MAAYEETKMEEKGGGKGKKTKTSLNVSYYIASTLAASKSFTYSKIYKIVYKSKINGNE